MPFLVGIEYHEYYYDLKAIVVYNVNDILLIMSIHIKCYLIFRFSLTCFTEYRNPRHQRLCTIKGTEASFLFAIKCLMQDRPYLLLSITTIISFILPAFCLRIAERPLMEALGSDANDFNDLNNCLWVIIITLTSVGYGDMSPVTNIGKIIGIIVALFGVFTTSLMVVTLENTTKI